MLPSLRAAWTHYVDRQHRYPTGWAGRLVGERMGQQHAPETVWSLGLLALQRSDRLLELGCGAGHALSLALSHCPTLRAIGLDLSATMLRAAAHRNRAALGQGRLSLLRADMGALPLRAGWASKLLSIHTIYFWPSRRATLQQLAAQLAPGGRLVITFATARREPTGSWSHWPLHEEALQLIHPLTQLPGIAASLQSGPDSRQFNNVALVLDREG